MPEIGKISGSSNAKPSDRLPPPKPQTGGERQPSTVTFEDSLFKAPTEAGRWRGFQQAINQLRPVDRGLLAKMIQNLPRPATQNNGELILSILRVLSGRIEVDPSPSLNPVRQALREALANTRGQARVEQTGQLYPSYAIPFLHLQRDQIDIQQWWFVTQRRAAKSKRHNDRRGERYVLTTQTEQTGALQIDTLLYRDGETANEMLTVIYTHAPLPETIRAGIRSHFNSRAGSVVPTIGLHFKVSETFPITII